jgi:hypothetical protein
LTTGAFARQGSVNPTSVRWAPFPKSGHPLRGKTFDPARLALE